MDRISELPKDMLHRILYFLSQKEAAQTSVLSKSWRYICSTRPNLDFSYTPPPYEETCEFHAKKIEKKREFRSIVNTTLQRYHDQRLSVEEFRLHISLAYPYYASDEESVLLLEKWIPLLTNMGLKRLHLSILSEHRPGRVELPPVVFGSKHLQDLHVERFLLDEKAIEKIVLFKHLKSLSLQEIEIEDELIFRKIISSCPLIETLDVHLSIKCKRVKVNDLHNLKKLKFYIDTFYRAPDEELCSLEIHPPSLEILGISYANIMLNEGAEFINLKELYLTNVESSLDHLSSCKFLNLKNLEIHVCDGLEGTHVCIDAPNLVYFEYVGEFVPSISIATNSKEWKSYIHISYKPLNDSPSPFLLKLKKLLESLVQSEISLVVLHATYFDKSIIPETIQNGGDDDKLVVVESLRFHFYLSSFPSLLNRFFRICRPRYIGHYLNEDDWDWEVAECLWKILIDSNNVLDESTHNEEWWFRDLEEARLEVYESSRDKWHATTLSELPNYDQSEYHLLRFALKWRET